MLGVPHQVAPSGVPEDALAGETPAEQVLRLARAKAEHVAARRDGYGLVIGADTLVVLGGRVLGQPRDEAEAAAMLGLLSGATHTVLTGVCLLRAIEKGSGRSGVEGLRREAAGLSESRVTFHPMTEAEIAWYVASKEPMDKAGAYAAQGLGAVFLRAIEGSFHNVVGFPVDLFYRLLPEVRLTIHDVRRGRP